MDSSRIQNSRNSATAGPLATARAHIRCTFCAQAAVKESNVYTRIFTKHGVRSDNLNVHGEIIHHYEKSQADYH